MRALWTVALVAGCTVQVPSQPICDASRWSDLVGQPEAAVYGALGNLRVIRPGEAITKDLNRDRLNAEIGTDGRIKRFGCY